MNRGLLILIVSLGVLAAVAAVMGIFRYRKYQRMLERGEIDALPDVVEQDEECCGQHNMCEKDSLLAAVSKEVEYYSDEELDACKHRSPSDYSPEETEAFREVFYTLREEEIAGWVRSLQLRQIELPDELKEEVYLVLVERRGKG